MFHYVHVFAYFVVVESKSGCEVRFMSRFWLEAAQSFSFFCKSKFSIPCFFLLCSALSQESINNYFKILKPKISNHNKFKTENCIQIQKMFKTILSVAVSCKIQIRAIEFKSASPPRKSISDIRVQLESNAREEEKNEKVIGVYPPTGKIEQDPIRGVISDGSTTSNSNSRKKPIESPPRNFDRDGTEKHFYSGSSGESFSNSESFSEGEESHEQNILQLHERTRSVAETKHQKGHEEQTMYLSQGRIKRMEKEETQRVTCSKSKFPPIVQAFFCGLGGDSSY